MKTLGTFSKKLIIYPAFLLRCGTKRYEWDSKSLVKVCLSCLRTITPLKVPILSGTNHISRVGLYLYVSCEKSGSKSKSFRFSGYRSGWLNNTIIYLESGPRASCAQTNFRQMDFSRGSINFQDTPTSWYVKSGGARGVMVIVVGNGRGDTSSNPGRDWLHFT